MADYDGLCGYLLKGDFHSCYSNCDVEKVWAFIRESILAAMPLFIPKTKLHSKQQPPWWTSNIKHKINSLRSIRKRRQHNLLPLSQHVQELELSLQVEMITDKNNFESKLVQDFAPTNSSKIYNHLHNVSKSKGYLYACV